MIKPGKVKIELDEALVLLKKFFDFELKRPKLYLGDKYDPQFLNISSRRDLARSYLVQMVYDDEKNGIFVPTKLLQERNDCVEGNGDRALRIFCFLHEGTHAFLVRRNPQLQNTATIALHQSKVKTERERSYVYGAFHEGLANYVAIRCSEQSGNQFLVKKAQEEHEDLTKGWNEWLSSEGFAMMAKALYHLKAEETQKVLLKYFQRNLKMITYYKYFMGYSFIQAVQPDAQQVHQMINQPPWKVRHLIYPDTYL